MDHDIPFGNSNRENGTTFLDFPLFLGIFQWDEPTKRVPFTAEPEIPEILTKWKAPVIAEFCRMDRFSNLWGLELSTWSNKISAQNFKHYVNSMDRKMSPRYTSGDDGQRIL